MELQKTIESVQKQVKGRVEPFFFWGGLGGNWENRVGV